MRMPLEECRNTFMLDVCRSPISLIKWPLWLRIQGPKASNNLKNEPSTSWTKMSASWDQPSKVGPHKLIVGCRPPPNSHVAPPMQARSPLQLVIDIEICLSWSSWEWWRDERNLVLHNSTPTFSLPMVFFRYRHVTSVLVRELLYCETFRPLVERGVHTSHAIFDSTGRSPSTIFYYVKLKSIHNGKLMCPRSTVRVILHQLLLIFRVVYNDIVVNRDVRVVKRLERSIGCQRDISWVLRLPFYQIGCCLAFEKLPSPPSVTDVQIPIIAPWSVGNTSLLCLTIEGIEVSVELIMTYIEILSTL